MLVVLIKNEVHLLKEHKRILGVLLQQNADFSALNPQPNLSLEYAFACEKISATLILLSKKISSTEVDIINENLKLAQVESQERVRTLTDHRDKMIKSAMSCCKQAEKIRHSLPQYVPKSSSERIIILSQPVDENHCVFR